MLSEHDRKLLLILASDIRVKHIEGKQWCVTKKDEIKASFLESFDDAVNFIFDNKLIKE